MAKQTPKTVTKAPTPATAAASAVATVAPPQATNPTTAAPPPLGNPDVSSPLQAGANSGMDGGQQDDSGRTDDGNANDAPKTALAAAAGPNQLQGNRADPTKRPYVVGTVPIRHDGEYYDIGYEIELTDKEADRLRGFVVPVAYGKE